MNALSSLLRRRNGHADSRVSFVELFFDLVFVFAITQLSHLLIKHFTPLGGQQTLLLLLAVWMVWIYTTWVTNWLNPEKIPVRVALFVMMGAGLILTSSLPEAFEERALPFAIAYVSLQVLRPLFVIWAARGEQVLVQNFWRIFVWAVAAGGLWIYGALADPSQRLGWWSAAMAIELMGPIASFYTPGLGKSSTADWNVSGEHMAERCGLFVIIALGESVLVTGNTFSHLPWNSQTVAAMLISLLGSILMWWIYFDDSAASGSEFIEHSDDPGRIARLSYTYVHILIVAGIMVAAVADEFVLHHPEGHADIKTTLAILGSNALFLLGNLTFKYTIYRHVSWSHLAGLAGLAALIPAVPLLSPVGLAGSALAILGGVAIWERQAWKACEVREELEIEIGP